MQKISIINPFDAPEWDDRVKDFPNVTIFHSSAWAKLLVGCYGFVPKYFAAFSGEIFFGAMPFMETRDIFGRRKGISLPFSDFCDPLIKGLDSFNNILDCVKKMADSRSWHYFEIRGGKDFLEREPVFQQIYTHDLDLSVDEKKQFSSFRDSTRRNILNAEKKGVTVAHSTSIDALKIFYRLNCLTRREHGLPPQPWKFFLGLWHLLLKNDHGFLSIASFNGKAIAGNLYLIHAKKAFYKYGASDSTYQHLRPSNLVMWEGIRQCREKGCLLLNFGRTEPHHQGLLQFKHGFGCKETTCNYYRFDCKKQTFVQRPDTKTTDLQSEILSRLPIPVLRMLGTFLYKYAG